MDRSSKQRINKEPVDENNIQQMNLTDKNRTFYLTTAEYTFFSSMHGTFSRTYHMFSCLRKFKKIEIIPNIFSDHNCMKLEINNRRKTGKFTNTWKFKNTFLNIQWIKEITEEIKSNLRQMKMETQHIKICGI